MDRIIVIALAATILTAASNASAIPLRNGLGGVAGFGENTFTANDDGSQFVSLTPVFDSGLNFFGTTYDNVWINNNGNITFNSAQRTFTPFVLTSDTNNPIIAPFFADVDTRGGAVTASPGGTSTGSNLVYWDLDDVNDIFTVTWDDVGSFNSNTDQTNAFQLSLFGTGGTDFNFEFRYENIEWTTGSASGTTAARAGFSSGNGVDFFELPISGDVDGLLNLSELSNINIDGNFQFTSEGSAVVNPPINSVPLPGTLSLLGAGLLFGLRPFRRRKNNAN